MIEREGDKVVSAVVRVETPEEREYARYLNEIEVRKRRVVDLQADLSLVKEQLGRFSAEYHTRVGTLLVDLDKILLSIDGYAYRIARLEEDSDLLLLDLELEIRDAFADKKEQVRADEEAARGYENTYREDLQRPRLDERSEEELKSLFRALAKRFHPDLARTEVERLRREVIMRRVTAAFHDQDVVALQGLLTETDVEDPMFEVRPIGERLVWSIREVSRLDSLIDSVIAEQAALLDSALARLWRRQEAGEDLLGRLEQTTSQQIEEARAHLDEVIERYRHLTGEANYGQ